MRLIDSYALCENLKGMQDRAEEWYKTVKDEKIKSRAESTFVTLSEVKFRIDGQPTIDAVPWEFLERYAEWFCAMVSFPEFIREAKQFYLDAERYERWCNK